MKTRAFKKVLSVICVIALLMSICVVGLIGTSSAASHTYTFYVNGVKYAETTLAEGAALPNPGTYKGAAFEGWYDETYTNKQDTAGAATTLYAKYSSNIYGFEFQKPYYDPNNKTANATFDFNITDPTDAGNKVARYKLSSGAVNFGLPACDGLFTQGYKLKPGVEYTISLRYYGDNASGNPNFRVIASKREYVGGVFANYGLGSSAADTAIKQTARRDIKTQDLSVVNGTWKTATLKFSLNDSDVENNRFYLQLAMYKDGTGSVLFDDIIITEDATENEVTFVDNGNESKQTMVEMSELPKPEDPNFIGWFDETLTNMFAYSPAYSTKLYAKYSKVSDIFEDGESKVFDPNNKFPADNGFKIVEDAATAGNHVLTAPIGNTIVDNYAITGAIGANGGFTIAKGQRYTVKFTYKASGIGSMGAKVFFKSVDNAGIGAGNDTGSLGDDWSVAIENTDDWKKVELNAVYTGSLDLAVMKNLVMAVYGEDSNGTIVIDNFSVGPYTKPIAAPDFVMDFEAEGGFKWSVADANNYNKDSGNGYVNRGELITEADSTFFRVSHFAAKDAYIYFTLNDGANQFKLEDRAIYSVDFDYRVTHAETPTTIGLVLVKPSTGKGLFVKLVELKSYCKDNNDNNYVEVDEKEWNHVSYTFGSDLSDYADYTSLGLYVFNSTNVPERDPDLNKLTASVVDFDNIVVKTHSKNIGDGMIIFDSKGGTECDTIITPSGEPVGALPQPTRVGYVFKGWEYETSTGVVDFTSNTLVPGFITTVSAKWEVAPGVVEIRIHTNVPTYDAMYPSCIAYAGKTFIDFPTVNPSLAGQEFIGWYYDTGFTKKVDFNVAPKESCDVYAKWGKGAFTCDFEDFDTTGPSARAKFVTDPATGNNYLDWSVEWATTNTSDTGTLYCTYINKGGVHFTVVDGYEYTVTFKYKLLKAGVTVGAVTHNKQNGWSDRKPQAETVRLDTVTGDKWETASFTFTASPATSTANYLSLGIADHGHILVDDIVVTSAFNNMNIYGSAIIFDTNGGKLLSPISGEPGSKITLPTPTKAGYKFLGWYTDSTFTTKFTDTVYGTETVNLFAKWQLGKYNESFEDYPNAVKSLGIAGAYSIYDSKTAGFDKANVYSGNTSLFRKGNSAGVKSFTTARSADLELTKGETYTLTMYVKPTSVSDAAGTISLIYMSTFTGINNASANEVIVKVADLKEGEWNKVQFTFEAKDKFVGISSTAGNDMYIDDVTVTLKGYTGSANTGDTSVNPFFVAALVLLCAGALLITGKKVFAK